VNNLFAGAWEPRDVTPLPPIIQRATEKESMWCAEITCIAMSFKCNFISKLVITHHFLVILNPLKYFTIDSYFLIPWSLMLSIACCGCNVHCIMERHLQFQIKTDSVSKNIIDVSTIQNWDDCRNGEQNTYLP
jgi:hypothetical protein